MEIKVIEEDKDLLEFYLVGERHTLPNLLKTKLLDDSGVSFVSYTLDHPLDTKARFVLRANSGSPKKALEKACKAIEDELSEFEKEVKKTFK